MVKDEVLDSYNKDIILEIKNEKNEDINIIIGKVFEGLKKLNLLQRIQNNQAV